MPKLTTEVLRDELKQFAEAALHKELESLGERLERSLTSHFQHLEEIIAAKGVVRAGPLLKRATTTDESFVRLLRSKSGQRHQLDSGGGSGDRFDGNSRPLRMTRPFDDGAKAFAVAPAGSRNKSFSTDALPPHAVAATGSGPLPLAGERPLRSSMRTSLRTSMRTSIRSENGGLGVGMHSIRTSERDEGSGRPAAGISWLGRHRRGFTGDVDAGVRPQTSSLRSSSGIEENQAPRSGFGLTNILARMSSGFVGAGQPQDVQAQASRRSSDRLLPRAGSGSDGAVGGEVGYIQGTEDGGTGNQRGMTSFISMPRGRLTETLAAGASRGLTSMSSVATLTPRQLLGGEQDEAVAEEEAEGLLQVPDEVEGVSRNASISGGGGGGITSTSTDKEKSGRNRKSARTSTVGVDMAVVKSREDRRSRRFSQDMYFNVKADQLVNEEESILVDFVQGPMLGYISAMVIFANAITMGVQTDYMARHWTDHVPVEFEVLEVCFLFFFTVEILLRMYVYGKAFFCSKGWAWNVFDVCLVCAQCVDDSSLFLAKLSKTRHRHEMKMSRLLRIVRILRLARVLRIIRILSLFGELRMLLVAIAESGRSVCWCIMLLLMMTYCMSVYLTQVVTDHKVEFRHTMGEEERHMLQSFFGSLDRSMLSMYEMISDGIHWHEVMEPLTTYCSPWLAFVFIFYMGFTVFAVLNVVTGVFVDTAMHTATDDKKKVLMFQMRELFIAADADKSGTVTFEEFEAQMETKEMKAMLRAVDLDEDEAVDLFHLLDIENTGELQVDAFVNGVQRLTGTAKAIELAGFLHEWKRWVCTWQLHAEYIEDYLDQIYESTRLTDNDGHDVIMESSVAPFRPNMSEMEDAGI